jgi:aminoglycoside phosphotransferase (APT) family kinase protein
MTSDEREQIAACLTRMGVDPAFADYQTLAAGVSGSHVYWLRRSDDIVILKLTLAHSEPYIWARAGREFAFYQTLADQLPVRTPRLLAGCADQDFGVCMLLTAHQPVTSDWQTTDYANMAAQLADLHAHFWTNPDDLAVYDWLRQPVFTTSAEEIASALSGWQALRDQPRLQSALTAPAYELVCHRVMEIAAVDAIIRSWPVALYHGDCHRDNFLRDDQGNLVWADWQEVGVGAGPEDLSFFWQRAAAVGDVLPVEQMLTIYHGRLQAQTDAAISLPAVQRVAYASELRATLLHWPFYLQQASVAQIGRLLQRIEQLLIAIKDTSSKA